MPTTSAPHKAILAISRHLRTVTAELAHLNESLLPDYSGPLSGRTDRPHVPQHRVAPKKVIPKPVATTRPIRVNRATGTPLHRLTNEQEADIVLLLSKTRISVGSIAKMFGVKRPSIYNIRDKHKLNVHRGNAALMAGIARYKAKRTKPAKSELPPLASEPITPAVVEQAQQTALAEAAG